MNYRLQKLFIISLIGLRVFQRLCTLDYTFSAYHAINLVKMDILLNGEVVDALSTIVYRPTAFNRGIAICRKLKKIIPRQQFEVPIQAAINNKVIARTDIKAVRKAF